MIYEIYGQTRKWIFEFRKFDMAKYGVFGVWTMERDLTTPKIRSYGEYETVLLDTETTDWIYEDGDHITYQDREYTIERVVKTIHDDHAKVYTSYLKDLGNDEESKKRAEAEKEIYEHGKEDGINLVSSNIRWLDPKRKRWSWKRFARV